MDTSESIKISVPDSRERKKRQRELLLALAGILLVVLLTWIELKYLGVNSFLFIGLFNLNFVFMMVILFVVFRNVVKLVLERRRKVLGSKLRTRLVLSFMTLSLVPTLLMFMVGVKFVQTSVDYWFKSKIETSLEQALEVGQAFYSSSQERLERRGGHILERIRERRFAWGGKTMDEFLGEKRQEYDLGLLGVIAPDLTQQNWHMPEDWGQVWREVRDKINWEDLRERPQFWSTIRPGPGADLVFGLLPVDEGKTGYLALGESIGHGLLYRLDKIVVGVDDYKQMRTMKYPIKVAMYMTLGVIALLIVLGAIWFGFRLAKELSAPVQALAAGTQRIAKGDLTVRLEDQSSDELGFLVKSFNRMAEDLEVGRERLTQANIRLGQQNWELESRGRYIEALLDNMTAGVISLDGEGRISTVNKAAEAMLGLDSHQILRKRPLELISGGEYADLLREVLEQLQSNPATQWQRQLDLTLGSKELKLLINVVVLKTSEGQEAGLVAVFEDVTELDKMQRLAAWREVARRIAHEIKNPLTPIKLSAQRIDRKFSSQIDDPVFVECTNLIIRQVEHLQQMVKEFSTFAKLPEVVLKKDYLAPLIEEVVADFRNSHHGIEWELAFDGAVPQIKMDRQGVRRALINILTNAAEVLRDRKKGRVEVQVSHDSVLGWVRIEVRDNGPGLTDEERSRLFEPYFSQKKGGTGLGLTIVRSIISDHRGYVRAKPNQPRGTTLVIELPA